MKKLSLILLLLLFVIAGCGGQEKAAKDKLQVAASFYPMAEFARNIGGEKVEVITMVPDGAEAHDWEPSPSDLAKLGRAQVFVYNGIVESWAEQAVQALGERQLVAVQAGKDLYSRQGKQDPHVWISPKKAIIEVNRITEALCQVDQDNASYYQGNRDKYVVKLKALDKQLSQLTSKAPRKVFVTAHAAFGHLADDYGLQQLAVNGLSPTAEPTPADLQQLIKMVEKENIEYIFFETLTDPKTAELLAKETGAKTAVLDPLEGLSKEGRAKNMDYLQIMQQNIHNLNIALNTNVKAK